MEAGANELLGNIRKKVELFLASAKANYGILAADFKIQPKHLIWTVFGVVVLWLISGILIYNWAPGGNYGTFGDMFGAINSLFSGLAFSCLIFATLMQREELKLQRNELELAREEAKATRKEIEGQKLAAQLQNSTLARQSFENLFFQTLNLHNQLVGDLGYENRNVKMKGKYYIGHVIQICKDRYNGHQSFDGPLHVDTLLKILTDSSSSYDTEFAHYFRSVNSVLSIVDAKELSDKQFYANLFRDQMSNSETVLLFYWYGFGDQGLEAHRSLLNKYSFLRNLDKSHLVSADFQRGHFNENAFSVSFIQSPNSSPTPTPDPSPQSG